MKIDWHRLGFATISAVVSTAAGYYGQPFVNGNSDAIGVIVNVFSILAGFLVTIMTLLGDPSAFRGKTWRSDSIRRSVFYRQLVRHKWLFVLYLLILCLVFITSLLIKKMPESNVILWLQRIYIGLSCFAFIASLTLPSRLIALQLTRFDEMVEARRNGKQ